MGHFQVIFFHKNWDLSYRHIYLGHPLKLKGVGANIILGDFIIVTPNYQANFDECIRINSLQACEGRRIVG
jgi:hypothetical protein